MSSFFRKRDELGIFCTIFELIYSNSSEVMPFEIYRRINVGVRR